MKCNHCGLCCSDPRTQIAITIRDLQRISEHLNVEIKDLFKEHISIQPFADQDLLHYDLDLGLNIPCKFRKNKRCSIHPARPLNCRLFPAWILADASEEKIPELLKEHKCEWDMEKRQEYKEYRRKIGEQLLKESRLLELKNKIDIREIKGYKEEMEEKEKIMLIKKAFDKLIVTTLEKILKKCV